MSRYNDPMTPEETLARLSRSDKWYLASGRGALFAPTFPRYLDRPGFWDEAFFADIRLDRLFTVIVADDEGKPLPLSAGRPKWNVHRLRGSRLCDGLRGLESSVGDDEADRHSKLRTFVAFESHLVTARNTFACHWEIQCLRIPRERRRFHLLQWSLQQKEPFVEGKRMASVASPEVLDDCLVFAHRVQAEKGVGDVWVALGASLTRASYTVNLAEMSATEPQWEVSPFPEKFRRRASGKLVLPDESHADADWNGSIFGPSLLHLGQHYVLDLEPGDTATVTFAAAVAYD
ncbi:MAG TPA: hypothetical protein VM490_09185, partial [Armatimonadaceae bacterium]|nr:hypothetical protein [Armatimonadaceae bacterium]